MKKLKITIIGNSVAMRIRPPQELPKNLNYGQILENKLLGKFPAASCFIDNESLHRATTQDVLNRIDMYLKYFPDYFIINLGIVDTCTREIPLWYSNIINYRKNTLTNKFLSPLYYNYIRKHRRFFVRIRGYKPWESAAGFKKKYQKLLDLITKETNAKKISLSINPPTRRIENELPGSRKNIIAYNHIIEELSKSRNHKFINLAELKPDIHCPDGVHFSREGHEVVAGHIYRYLIEDIADNSSLD